MATSTDWQHKFKTGNICLPQLEHLETIVAQCQTSVSLIVPFEPFNQYANSSQGELRLYAQTDWQHIDWLVSMIDSQLCQWVYVAINRYLLMCHPDPNAHNDYDIAIKQYFENFLTNYCIIDYQYQNLNFTGNVGNFVIPDNRLLCKRVN